MFFQPNHSTIDHMEANILGKQGDLQGRTEIKVTSIYVLNLCRKRPIKIPSPGAKLEKISFL